MAKKDEWIQSTGISKPGSKGKLHRALGVALDKKIPEKKLMKATHSKNPTLKKEAVLAETLKGFRKK
jgi:hypothetical protein